MPERPLPSHRASCPRSRDRGCGRAALLVLMAAVLVLGSCSREAAERYYPLRGRVVAVTPERNEISIDHQPIAGFMAAMTMPFPVARRQLLDGIAPGDEVEAVLLVEDGRFALVSLAKSEPAPAPRPAATAADGA